MCHRTESKSRVMPVAAMPLAEREAIVGRFNQRYRRAAAEPSNEASSVAQCGEKAPRDASSAFSGCRLT